MRKRLWVALFAACIAVPVILADQGPAPPRVDRFGVPLPEGAITRLGYDGVMVHGYSEDSFAVSDDGKMAATTDVALRGADGWASKHEICVWDLTEKKPARKIPVDSWVSVYSFTRDGKQILGAIERKPALWDIASGTLLWKNDLKEPLIRVWLDSPANHAVVFYREKTAKDEMAWRLAHIDLATGKSTSDWTFATTTVPYEPEEKHERSHVVADLSADGSRLVAAVRSSRKSRRETDVRFYDVREKKLIRRIGLDRSPLDVKLSPDNERAVVRYWWQDESSIVDAKTGAIRPVKCRHILCWYDDKTLAVKKGGAVYLFDVDSGKERKIATAAASDDWGFRNAVFSRDLKTLVTNRNMIQVWDVATGRDRNPEWESIFPRTLRFGETTLHANDRDVWDRATWKRIDPVRIDESRGDFQTTIGDATGVYLGNDDRLTFVDLRSGKTLCHGSQKIGQKGYRRGSVVTVVSRDQKRVCLGWDHRLSHYASRDQRFKVFDVADGRFVCEGIGEAMWMSSEHVICKDIGKDREEFHLFDIRKSARIRELKDLYWQAVVEFSPDSKRLLYVVAKDEKAKRVVKVWNVAPWQEGATIEMDSPTDRAEWSPDGRLTIVRAKQVQFLDPMSGKKLAVLDLPDANGFSLSPDGKTFATTGRNSITIWDYKRCVELGDRK